MPPNYCGRIVDDVSEISVESHQHGVERLRASDNLPVFRINRQVVA